jgi:hypothetical protein
MIQTMKWLRRVLTIGLIVLLIAALGFLVWALWVPAPMPAALAALESDERVQVTTGDWLVFTPMTQPVTSGFIFYPGGRVDGRSYAPAARAIAAAGHLVVIPSMPLNLAVFAPNRAVEVQAAYPTITTWGIGGHSLGGAMAASFVFRQAGTVDTLVLWASFPAENQSLADRTALTVASIYGTLDGLATVDEIEQSRSLLPPDTTFVPIVGGNHAQFGWYGDQRGDNPATISRVEQQEQAVNATLEALNIR